MTLQIISFLLSWAVSLYICIMLWTALFVIAQVSVVKLSGGKVRAICFGALRPLLVLSVAKNLYIRIGWLPVAGKIDWSGPISPWARTGLAAAGGISVLASLFLLAWIHLVSGVSVCRAGALIYVARENASFPLRGGDIITHVDTNEIRHILDLNRLLRQWEDGPRDVSVNRAGGEITVRIDRPDWDSQFQTRAAGVFLPVVNTMRLSPGQAARLAPRSIVKIAIAQPLFVTALREGPEVVWPGLFVLLMQSGLLVFGLYHLPIPNAPGWGALSKVIQETFKWPAPRILSQFENLFVTVLVILLLILIGLTSFWTLGLLRKPEFDPSALVPRESWFQSP